MVSKANILINKQSNVISANYNDKSLKLQNPSQDIREQSNLHILNQQLIDKNRITGLKNRSSQDEFIRSQNSNNVVKVNFKDKNLAKPKIADTPPPFEPWGVGIGLDIAA